MDNASLPSICFIFFVYQDEHLARNLIKQLKLIIGESKKYSVICILDGNPKQNFLNYLKTCENIKYFVGERLKLQINGGTWLEKIFTTFLLESTAEYLVKIEPDSTVFRSFSLPFPNVDIAGSLVKIVDGRQLVHGGCILFKRKVIKKVVESKLLESSKYKTNRKFGYRRYLPPYLQAGEIPNDEWLISGDAVLADVIQELNFTTYDWKEVSCGIYPSSFANEKWAVFHPKKSSYGFNNIKIEVN